MKQIYYAIQNIIRGKDSTLIKVVSLSLGLFLSIVLFALIGTHLSYNSFYQDYKNIYVVQTAWDLGNRKMGPSPYNIFPTGETLMKHFPEQVKSATVINESGNVYRHGTEKHKLNTIKSDSLFFQTMGIPLLQGNAKDLAMTDALFLSESAARKVFGHENPMGKTLKWMERMEVIVKGIFADIPENTTINTEAVLCIHDGNSRLDWTSGGNYRTMIRMKEGGDADYINERTGAVFANYLPIDDYYSKEAGVKGIDISITPLKGYNLKTENSVAELFIIFILGLVLLLTASFNYILISISSLAHRAKAIGVHKCSGAETGTIFGIFFWETLFITGISVLVAIFLILNFHDQIENLFLIKMETLFAPGNLWVPALTILILFTIGCIMPGKLFSSIPVTQIFRQYSEGKKHWKYPLLFVQFIGASFLIGFVCVTFLQHQYATSKDLGWSSERLAYGLFQSKKTNGLNYIRNLPYVEAAENAQYPILIAFQPTPVKDSNGNIMFYPRLNSGNEDFCRLVNLKLLEGTYHTREGEMVVNRAFVKKMGWTSNGVGEVVPGMGTVTGIIHYSFPDRDEMEPYGIQWWNNESGTEFIHIRLKEPFDENLIRLNKDMQEVYPRRDIEFWSAEKDLKDRFIGERNLRDSILIACIAILAITLMGLTGYTNEEVQRRSKEIAIRKVNGAEVSDILQMLCRDIVIIALPSVIIGVLLSWQVGDLWVSSHFKDILAISPIVYISVAIVSMAFILGTVIVKSWRVANENPVLSIKSE